MKGKVIYQLSLRTMTPEGTLKSAMQMIPHISSLGVDYIYLTACFAADDDPDESTWSQRQRESGCNNPKNSYKMKDYFHVDEEYGSDEDLQEFVKAVHDAGMKIMFDLVYLHCGRNAVFISDHPDFVKRNPDGTILIGEIWPFARFNFDNPELREYLYGNMEYLLKEYKIDGFRCDVAYRIPLDFWVEGIKRLRKVKPDILMLNEGNEDCDYIDGGFDINYHLRRNRTLAKVYRDNADINEYKSFFGNKKYLKNYLNFTDNHDEASDVRINRHEKVLGTDGAESMLVLTFAVPGIPYIWNGIEVCDDLENCMFSNRFYGRRNNINWANALTEKGKNRVELVKTLAKLYHLHEALNEGDIEFLDAPERLLCFTRSTKNEKMLICINTCSKPQEVEMNKDFKSILEKNTKLENSKLCLDGYGYIIAQM